MTMRVRAWRIFYGDGSACASTEIGWSSAPDDDVQVLMLYHDRGYRTIVQGEDTYRLTGDPGEKRGRWMEDGAYAALVARALVDPPPSSRGTAERAP